MQNHSLPVASAAELAEILPIAFVQFDPKGKVMFMNRVSTDLLSALNLAPEAFPHALPTRHRSLVRQALRERRVEEMNWVQNGLSLHLIFKAAPDGESAYVFMIDLTAQEEAKAQLMQSEKMASLGLLVAGLAHEINTPLGAIHSNNDTISRSVAKIIQLLEREDGLSDEDRQRVRQLVEILRDLCDNNTLATDRLISIVGSLKNFARVDEADLKEADIHEGLDSTLTIVQHQLKGRVEVVKQYGNIPPVHCHPNRLNQVFMNLLINAAQAIPDHGTITIKTFKKGDAVKIAISDTGVGISPENLSRIFDPGFTTKGVGVGTGLGLSICYKIIEEHQGKIEVESNEKGTTFTISLPLGLMKKVKRG